MITRLRLTAACSGRCCAPPLMPALAKWILAPKAFRTKIRAMIHDAEEGGY